MKDWYWLNERSLKFLNNKAGYLQGDETPESRHEDIANYLQGILGIPGYAKDFLYFCKQGYYALSTPILSNVGRKNALPFSCSNQHIGDSLGEIFFGRGETAMMTKMGMGCSAYFSPLRPKGGPISNSVVPSPGSLYFAKRFDNTVKEVNQGVRRGFIAGYWDAEHPDIMDVLEIQRDGNDIQDMNYGICMTDAFLEKARSGDPTAQATLIKVHESRFMTGLPYLFFTDNVNRAKPDTYVELDLTINSSNLCTEILEVSNEKYSFVCDIAAMNATKIDQPDFERAVRILTYALDALHTDFQSKLEGWRDSSDKEDNLKFLFLQKAYRSSVDFRDIGLGCTGFHSMLQERGVSFSSMEARELNIKLFSTIQRATLEASKELAEVYGPFPMCPSGKYRRNNLKNAIAPNTSSGFIYGQLSQGNEPIFSNYYVKDIAKAKVPIKNSILKALLKTKDLDTKGVWDSILAADGSVQHLEELSKEEKSVFETFREILPDHIITLAAQRQPYIDQGQSTNTMIDSSYGLKEVNELLYKAWKMGIKTLYYQHSVNSAQEFTRKECESCAG